jgi:non-ribosomal peptide synthetase-like protein
MDCFTARQTFRPGVGSILMRGAVDLTRVFLPGLILMGVTVSFCASIVVAYKLLPLWACFVLTPAAALASLIGAVGAVVMLKFMLMGTFRPTVKPLWCSYVWLNEVVNGLYEAVVAPMLTPLMGTPLIAPILRLLGSKIGRWVFIESTLLSEFDLVEIGDRAAVNLGCTVQTHLFEDRIMKSDRIKIGDDCSVGNMAVVLYATEMGKRSVLAPMSVLMKGERLPEGTRWIGIPTQPLTALAQPHAA